MKRTILFSTALLALLACGSKDEETPLAPNPARAAEEVPPAIIGGTPSPDEIEETHGVFVASIGNDSNNGSRLAPLATLGNAISMAEKMGKRVYVCAGRYEEAITIPNGVSMVGGLDCSDAHVWRVGTARSQIAAPTSPAVVVRNVDRLTRFEGFEVIAPDGDATNRSSIALLADHASAFVVANTKLTAGRGRDGLAGLPGIQLQPQPHAAGNGGFPAVVSCTNQFCRLNDGGVVLPAGGLGGASTCAGAPGHDPASGGVGGSGGVMKWFADGLVWLPYLGHANQSPTAGAPGSASGGENGSDGLSWGDGAISPDGFVPADGSTGTDGMPGASGAGGLGFQPLMAPNGQADLPWTGYSGGGGGAGGCPGLAGSPGQGGGASIAALLVESAVVVDASELVAGDGGRGGEGTFGSDATNGYPGGTAAFGVGAAGGNGGRAGTSGHGAGGPSIAIASSGVSPIITGSTKLAVGAGGAGVSAKSKTDVTGTRTIPASSAGRAEPQHAF